MEEEQLNNTSTVSKTVSKKPQHGILRKLVRRVFTVILVLILIPFILTPVIAIINPPVSMLMVINRIKGEPIDYRWRPISQISDNLVRATVTAEDARLCAHHGVDWEVLRSVIGDALSGENRPRGGSTITMQTAKNLFLWPSRSYLRKAIELPLASWMDLIWSKQRTMEIYLNIAEWGPGIYGAEAAAQHHFKRSAAKLSRRQATLLAAALPNPHDRRASKPGPVTRKAAKRINRRLKSTEPYLDCLRRALK